MQRSSRFHGCAALALLAILALSGAPPVLADWPSTPTQGVPLCTADGAQGPPAAIADGAGGAGFAWIDARDGAALTKAYVQHLCALGNPLCAPDGISVGLAQAAQDPPALVGDGEGGFIVVWRDFRADSAGNLYAQRLSGVGEALWDLGGVPVNLGPLHETQMVAVSDDAGGVIVAWRDDRDGSGLAIRAQHLAANGAQLWDADGRIVAPNPADQSNPRIALDGAGGAVVAWIDLRGLAYNVFSQRLAADGSASWAPAGVCLSTSALGVTLSALAPDGHGGAFAALLDNRSLNTWQQAYAQHVDGSGAVVWAGDGVSLSGPTWPVLDTQVCFDGGGGAFFGWRDDEGGGEHRVSAAHFDSAGTALGSAPVGYGFDAGGWFDFSLTGDGVGGALLAWTGLVGPAYSVFVQRIDGSSAPQWTEGGVTLAKASYIATRPRLVPDGRAGAIAAWMDYPLSYSPDLYAARVDQAGQPGTASVPMPAPVPLRLSIGPSPASAGQPLVLRLSLPAPGTPRVTLFDVAGRRVRSLEAGTRGAGLSFLRWDGRDERGRRVEPGLYLARLESAGGSATAKVVLAD